MKSISAGEWIGIVIGASIVTAGLYWARNMYIPWKEAIHTQGVVTSILQEADDEDGYLYYAMVSYTNKSGDSQEFKTKTGHSRQHFTVGEKVEVIYLVNQKAMVDQFAERWLGPIFVVGLGLGVLTIVYFISRIKT